jgi:hypothetical protein
MMLGLFFVDVRTVVACSCIGALPPTCRAFYETPLVFIATREVTPSQRLQEAVDNPDGSTTVRAWVKPGRAAFLVNRVFRGSAPPQFDVPFSEPGGPSGVRYLIFAHLSKENALAIGCCNNHTQPLEDAQTELEFIESLANKNEFGTIAGQLTEPDGTSVSIGSGWKVVIQNEDETLHEAKPDWIGNFEVNKLRPGRYALHVFHDDVRIPYTRALLVAPNACPQERIRVPVVTFPEKP